MKHRPAPLSFRDEIRKVVLSDVGFIRLTSGSPFKGANAVWKKVVARPVEIRGRRHIQFTFSDGRKDFARNGVGPEVAPILEEVLALPFTRWHLHTISEELNVRVTKDGRPFVSRIQLASPRALPSLAHDRVKPQPLATGADALLRALGIQANDGSVRASMQDKYRQINEFIRILAGCVEKAAPRSSWRVVDCGCGSAYLTFAAYHHLQKTAGNTVRVDGVDVKADRIRDCNALRDQLAWTGMAFHATRILDFAPGEPHPDVTLSLHACDTATDEALAQGVRWGSEIILAAPCCQHELHSKLDAAAFRAVLKHGILRERTADILTDAFRAQILRLLGYRVDVIEFVSSEHTSKNLMVRAVKTSAPADAAAVREYLDLKTFWNVTPHLEQLLGPELKGILTG